MNYTVNQLAKLSGVTIRTLRFYDAIGLLKPAFVAENGYRYYQEKELLLLQQILFLRELGFELKQIQSIIKQGDFNKLAALQSHKKTLKQEIKRLHMLMVTIDKTINHLQGKQTMNEKELFYGLHNFSPEFQKFYRDAMEKASDEAKELFDQIYEHEKNMSDQEKKALDQDKQKFWKELVQAFQKRLHIEHKDVQRIMRNYISFSERSGIQPTKKLWLASTEAFRRMPESFKKSVKKFPELKPLYREKIKIFDENPGLENFLADAMKYYAEHNMA